MALKIEDYGIIGDTHTAAMVGRNGSIDWLCLPRLDSPACFAHLLGTEENGFWRIAPKSGVVRTSRQYRGDTLILETTFDTAEGSATVIDFMPWRRSTQYADVIRIVRGDSGRVTMEMRLALRFAHGRSVPWVRRADHGITAIAGPDGVEIHTSVPMHGEGFQTVAEFDIEAGKQQSFRLHWHLSHERPGLDLDPWNSLCETEERWKAWSAQYTGDGLYRKEVMRSLITLKALTYSPTGGIAAAVTTSLPEQIGGARNWDYRFCWLRDATFTLYAMLVSGFHDEAKAWREWLLRAVAGNPQDVQVLYGLSGERLQPEFEVPWLAGYEGSAPVRVGNAAHSQLQLDVFGEVMDALHTASRLGVKPTKEEWAVQRALLGFLEEHWQEPDEGLWEVRGGRQHFTHSRVMAWVAFDRAVKAVERYGMDGPVEKWRQLRQEIHAEVCKKGFSLKRNAFIQHYDSDDLDASLLMIPMVGFLPPDDPRVIGTLDAVGKNLMHDGLVQRYNTQTGTDGLPPGEGAFLACSFWYVDNLHLAGRDTEAKDMFERLLTHCNDLGLLSEEWDTDLKRQVGNFPQAFSHVALINSAHNVGGVSEPAKDRAEA
ncbi:MAG TPA: glycoside hydrolase family 15 protein [Tepidiformaceae bacterium]|nr:glycoside hydrolase family 15 protein [Tepidiformaceae bacterium]